MTSPKSGPSETWRPVQGEDGWYDVSSRGNVRSWYRHLPHGYFRRKEPRILKPGTTLGYKYVNLAKRGSTKIHLLVLEAFVGPRPDLGRPVEASHKNGNRADNRAENLEWVTAQRNNMLRWTQGTMPYGEQSALAKLTEAQVLSARHRYAAGERSISKMAKDYGVALATLSKAVRGETWRHL